MGHILGGKAGRIDQRARGQVPEGRQFLIDIVGKGLRAHSVFAIGRDGEDEAARAALLDGQGGPRSRGLLPVGRLTVEFAHHDVAIVGHVARCGTCNRCCIQSSAEVGGQTRLEAHKARIHTQGGIATIGGIKNSPFAIVGHTIHDCVVVEGQWANAWVGLGKSEAQAAACHQEQEHQQAMKNVGDSHIYIYNWNR